MKARLLEAAGGRPGPAGPSSRTKAGDAAGAGAFVFSALATSLLAAAALLLAPGAAWACLGFTTSSSATVTCSAATYPVSIRSTIQSNASVTVRVPGGSGAGGTATVITASTIYAGINLLASDDFQTGNYAIDVGTTAAVSIVDDAGSGNESPGLRIRQRGSGTATVDVGSQVTIGTSTSRMRAHGIYVRSSGSAGAATITNAGTIYASYEGIDVQHDGATTTTVTHSGAIDSLNHGIQAVTDGAGALMVTSSGGITVTNANQQGIRMRAQKNGAMTLTATGGTITTPAQGIYMESQGTGAVTLQGTAASAPTQSGPTITSSTSHGIHVHKSGSSATAGDISITTTDGSITAGTGTSHGIHVQDHSGYTGAVTIKNAADVMASSGRGINVSRLGSGSISVTVEAGATVAGGTVGVYVGGAATDRLEVAGKYTGYGVGIAPGEDPGDLDEPVEAMYGADALPNQLVTVRGTVTGGTGAAVHLAGGGGVLVLKGGSVRAGSSGEGILAAGGPALVYIDGEVEGGVQLAGGGSVTIGLNGQVLANDAGVAIQGSPTAPVTVTLVVPDLHQDTAVKAIARVDGGYQHVGDRVHLREVRNGRYTGYEYLLFVAGKPDPRKLGQGGSFNIDACNRCRMYEALPSMLLALNALPSRAERASAPRDARGGWARVEASRGEWRAKKARTAAKLAYDYSWVVARAGMDFAPREDLRVGFSVHAPRGKAEMAGVGEVELDGVGAGVSAAWRSGDFYVDAQAAATRYDVDFESYTQGKLLKKDASGVGYALGAEAGRRMPVGEAFVTPRAGLSWSKVNMDEFTDLEMADQPGLSRVSVEDAGSVKGRVGVTVEKEVGTGAAPGLLFGSLDVEHEFSDETEVKVGEQMLKTEVQPTALSLGAGAVFDVREDVLVRAVAGYRAIEGGASGYSGSLEVRVRF